jgi:hypothetical protein
MRYRWWVAYFSFPALSKIWLAKCKCTKMNWSPPGTANSTICISTFTTVLADKEQGFSVDWHCQLSFNFEVAGHHPGHQLLIFAVLGSTASSYCKVMFPQKRQFELLSSPVYHAKIGNFERSTFLRSQYSNNFFIFPNFCDMIWRFLSSIWLISQ